MRDIEQFLDALDDSREERYESELCPVSEFRTGWYDYVQANIENFSR